MLKIIRLLGVALMFSGTVALAQPAPTASQSVGPGTQREYWLGVGCMPVPPTLQVQMQLPEKQGLLVVGVLPDSPAAKAGIVLNDVMMKASDAALSTPQDLVRALEAGKGGKLKIELIHNGKQKTVEATPIERPAEARHPGMGLPAPDDMQTMMKWLEGLRQGGDPNGEQPPMRFHLIHPGAIVPQNAAVPPPLPLNMSIVISKEGDQPAKITVKQADQKWEITEKELDKLPADVRPHVERMLGRAPLDIVGALGVMDSASEGKAVHHGDIAVDNTAVLERMQKEFKDLNSRIDQLLKEVERLRELQIQPNPSGK